MNGLISPDKFNEISVDNKLFNESNKYLELKPIVIGLDASIDVGINSSFASPIVALFVEISIIRSFLIDNLIILYVISLSFAESLGDNKDTLSTASTNSSLLNFNTIGNSAGINLDVSG